MFAFVSPDFYFALISAELSLVIVLASGMTFVEDMRATCREFELRFVGLDCGDTLE